MKIASIKLFLIISIFLGCKATTEKYANEPIVYLSVDSLYKSDLEKKKYAELKKHFFKIWMDTSNCYMNDYVIDSKYPNDILKKILDFRISNILHTSNYDTLVFVVTFYEAWVNANGSKSGELTNGVIMKVLIDKEKNWHFDCRMNNFGYYSQGNKMEETELSLKKMIISSGYFSGGKINSNYVKDLFSTEVSFSLR